jgi:hypothetical protein
MFAIIGAGRASASVAPSRSPQRSPATNPAPTAGSAGPRRSDDMTTAEIRHVLRDAAGFGGWHAKSPVANRSCGAICCLLSDTAMFNASNSSVTIAVSLIGSSLSGSATAVVIVAAGGVLQCLLHETLPYIERAVRAFPDWRSRLLDTRWQGVLLRDGKRRLRARNPLLPRAEREDARSDIAPGQISFGQEPCEIASDVLMTERWVASNPRERRRASC